MIYTITITKQDFLENDYFDNDNCPCAIALKRVFPNATEISVDGFNFYIKDVSKFYPLLKVNMDKCDVASLNEDDETLSDLIQINAMSENPQEVIFTLQTI